MTIGSEQDGCSPDELTMLESTAAVNEHIPKIQSPVKPSPRTRRDDVSFEPGGELRLHFCAIARSAGDLAEPRARPVEIRPENVHRQRGHANDDTGDAIERRCERPDDTGLVDANEFRAELVERAAG